MEMMLPGPRSASVSVPAVFAIAIALGVVARAETADDSRLRQIAG